MSSLRNIAAVSFILFACLCSFSIINPSASAQAVDEEKEAPVIFHLSLYTVEKAQMFELLKEGITGEELDLLQTEWFKQGCLFKKQTPVLLKKGENKINVPIEKLNVAGDDLTNTLVVFFYEITRNGEYVDQAMNVSYFSYVAKEEEGVEKKIGLKDGKWKISPNCKTFRVFDFRIAARAFSDSFIYKMEIPMGDDDDIYTIMMNAVE